MQDEFMAHKAKLETVMNTFYFHQQNFTFKKTIRYKELILPLITTYETSKKRLHYGKNEH